MHTIAAARTRLACGSTLQRRVGIIALAALVALGGRLARAQGRGPETGVPSLTPPGQKDPQPSPGRPLGWRCDGTGIFPDTNPPTEWTPAGRNIRWKTKFDDPYPWGNAQPVVVGKRLIVFHEPTFMACLDADTGAILWRKDVNLLWTLKGAEFDKSWALWQERQQVAEGWRKGEPAAIARLKELDAILLPKVNLGRGDGCQTKYLKGYGFATPVTDGALVYVKNASGVLAAVDPGGDVKWVRDIGYNGGHSSVASPCLVDGRLLVWNTEEGGKGKTCILSCFEAKTGGLLWKTEPRPNGPGDGCASPIVLRLRSAPVVLTACGDIVRAADGKILAKEVHPQGFSTPPFHDDTVFFGVNGVVEAVRLSLTDETVTATPLWKAKPMVDGASSGMYGGQVYYDGHVYMLQSKGQYSVMEAATGEIKCAKAIHAGKWRSCYANLSIAGGRVYAFDMDGRGVVVKAGPAGEVLASNEGLGGGTASPFFTGDRIYVRNSQRPQMPCWIYCIEEEKKSASH